MPSAEPDTGLDLSAILKIDLSSSLVYSFLKNVCLFMYLVIERKHELGGGQRERERERDPSRLQALCGTPQGA